jgi:hypothetical protein
MKLSTLSTKRVIKLDLDAPIYIRDLPAKKLQTMFATFEKDIEEKPEETILMLFTDVICDKDAKKFDGFSTYEDLEEQMSIRMLMEIIQAIPTAIMPAQADEKK